MRPGCILVSKCSGTPCSEKVWYWLKTQNKRNEGWRWDKDDIGANDMEHIIKIHNANNESAWHEVLINHEYSDDHHHNDDYDDTGSQMGGSSR